MLETRKHRRLGIEGNGNHKFGSVDAGFFWHGGRVFGCGVALVLLFLPFIVLVYGLWAMRQEGVGYEIAVLPLDTLRFATAIAIALFAPLLPFRLWLLINAITNEKALDRAVAQDEAKNDAQNPGPSWKEITPREHRYHQDPDPTTPSHADIDFQRAKLAHILIDKKNHTSILTYNDILDIEEYLIGKSRPMRRDGSAQNREPDDNYLVMVALYEESDAMQRLTRSLARLKYGEPEEKLRLALLLEEGEHDRDGKETIDKLKKAALGDKKDRSTKNFPQRVIDGTSVFIRNLLRLLGYLLTPIVYYKWQSRHLRKSLFGDPQEYTVQSNDKDTRKAIKPTTYQAAIHNLMTDPSLIPSDSTLKNRDTRRSFVLAFVPKTGRLGQTHREEPQTKPRALNYGLYSQFGGQALVRRAVRLHPAKISYQENRWEIKEFAEQLKKLAREAKICHDFLTEIKLKEGEDWAEQFKKACNCNVLGECVSEILQSDLEIMWEKHDNEHETFREPLGSHLLQILTGYDQLYKQGDPIDLEQLALLCATPELVSLWQYLSDERSDFHKWLLHPEKLDVPYLLPQYFDVSFALQPPIKEEVDQWKPTYCTVYDAEDRPEPDQLLKAAYVYKFYRYLPALMLMTISESLCARVTMLSTHYAAQQHPTEIEALQSSARNVYELATTCENLLDKWRNKRQVYKNSQERVRILELRLQNRGLSSEEQTELENSRIALKRLETEQVNARQIDIQFDKDFSNFLKTAARLHARLQNWELEYIPREATTKKEGQHQEIRKFYEDFNDEGNHREYFWWRAGEYFDEFLAGVLESDETNEWGQYLDKAYPERSYHGMDQRPDAIGVRVGEREHYRPLVSQVVCLQAKLTYENLDDNWLISLFKADYATWFNYLLPGLHTKNLPIPLGGTSNHFQMEFLTEVGGWDAFNVAEDCDLGIWIARANKRVAIVESITWEVANHDVSAWIKQRSRWVKGYMQSYFVHMRQPFALWRELGGWLPFASFQLTIGAGFLLPMISALFYAMTFIYIISLVLIIISSYAGNYLPTPLFFINDIHYDWILPLGTGSFFIGNVVYFLILVIGQLRHPKPGEMRFVILWWIPYWLLMIIASLRALYEYLFDPFHWEKSDHSYLQ